MTAGSKTVLSSGRNPSLQDVPNNKASGRGCPHYTLTSRWQHNTLAQSEWIKDHATNRSLCQCRDAKL